MVSVHSDRDINTNVVVVFSLVETLCEGGHSLHRLTGLVLGMISVKGVNLF